MPPRHPIWPFFSDFLHTILPPPCLSQRLVSRVLYSMPGKSGPSVTGALSLSIRMTAGPRRLLFIRVMLITLITLHTLPCYDTRYVLGVRFFSSRDSASYVTCRCLFQLKYPMHTYPDTIRRWRRANFNSQPCDGKEVQANVWMDRRKRRKDINTFKSW